jgi:hypothetical protein
MWLARPGAELPAPSPSPSEELLGKAPFDLGGVYLCRRDFPYAAYALGEHYYPPNHPSFPDISVRPARCFATPADAGLAGYTEAAPPFLDREVAGIYLEPAPLSLVRQCRRAANTLGFPVPCPQLVPTSQANIEPAISASGFSGLFIFEGQYFAVPPEDPQARDTVHGGHLLLIGYRTRDANRLRGVYSAYFCPPRGRGPTEFIGKTFVQGVPAFLEACVRTARPNDFSLLDAHLNLRWSVRGVTYVMSVHGQTVGHQELLKYLGTSLTYVSPR